MAAAWSTEEVTALPLEAIGERYRRYRVTFPAAERAMSQSLQRYGQLAPIVVCQQEERPVLLDGFKRLDAARRLKGMTSLWARRLEVDEPSAKAAIYNLNRVSRRPLELEEAWIVQALVREDGLSQVEAAALLSRHKSWVCRRLAMLEKLSPGAREELGLGLLPPSLARQLTRLPLGNQEAALRCMREAALNSVELRGVVDLLLASGTREQAAFVLEQPRQALRQADDQAVMSWDPRLSTSGNRLARLLARVLQQLGEVQTWLTLRGRGELQACDRQPLAASLRRLSPAARQVAETTDDFVRELT